MSEPKLTARDRALDLAASIVETRAAEVETTYQHWRAEHPEHPISSATERAAYMECQLLARLIRERMSVRARAALSQMEPKA